MRIIRNRSINKLQQIERECLETVQKSHKVSHSVFNHPLTVLAVSAAAMVMDHNFLYSLLTQTFKFMGNNSAVIMAYGVTFLLNFIPVQLGENYLEAKYRLRKGAVLSSVFCIVLWLMLFVPVAGMRFSRMNENKSQSVSSVVVVNHAASQESTQEDAEVIKEEDGFDTEAFFNTLLLSLEPMVSSGFVFVLSLKSRGNVIDREIMFLEEELAKKRAELSGLEAARESMDADFERNTERIVREDSSLYEHEILILKEEADVLKTTARQMLAAHLADPDSTDQLVRNAGLLLDSRE